MKRRALWIGVVALLAIGGAAAWFLRPDPPLPVFNPNGPPTMDLEELIPEDLRLGPELPPNQNAYNLLQPVLAARPLVTAADKAVLNPPYAGGTPKAVTSAEKRRVLSELAKHSRTFEKIGSILKVYEFRWPLSETPWDFGPASLRDLKAVCADLRFVQRLQLEVGQVDDATQTALRLVRIAVPLYNSKGATFEAMTMRACIAILSASVIEFASSPQATEKALATILSALPTDLSLNSQEYAIKANLRTASSYAGKLTAGQAFGLMSDPSKPIGRILHRNPLDREDTLRRLVSSSRTVLTDLHEGLPPGKTMDFGRDIYSLIDYNWVATWLSSLGANVKDYDLDNANDRRRFWEDLQDIDNPIGKGIVYAMFMTTEKEQLMRTITHYGAARLVCALRIYKERFDQYPNDLEGLVSTGILRRLPVDRFADKGFLYDPKRRQLWSIGQNLKDDGGKVPAGSRGWIGPDYVFKLP